MATPKQISANRQNAKKSTGPRSASGKAISARNARKHGILGADIAHENEDPAAFDELVGQLRDDLRPNGALEEALIDQLAVAFWRNRRLVQAERDVLNHCPQASYTIEKSVLDDLGDLQVIVTEVTVEAGTIPIDQRMLFGRYQAMISNETRRCLTMFYEAQERRLSSLEAAPQPDEETART